MQPAVSSGRSSPAGIGSLLWSGRTHALQCAESRGCSWIRHGIRPAEGSVITAEARSAQGSPDAARPQAGATEEACARGARCMRTCARCARRAEDCLWRARKSRSAELNAAPAQEEVDVTEFHRRAPRIEPSSFLLTRSNICPVGRKVVFIKDGCAPQRVDVQLRACAQGCGCGGPSSARAIQADCVLSTAAVRRPGTSSSART